MRRGEIWWADLGRVRNVRPVLLLTRDGVYSVRTHITVAPLTRTAHASSYEVPVGLDEGLRQASVVNLDDIQTIPIASLERMATALSARKMAEVASAIKYALDLD